MVAVRKTTQGSAWPPIVSGHSDLSCEQLLDEHRATAAIVDSASTQSLPLGHCEQPTKKRDLRGTYPEGAVFSLKWKNISSFISFPYTEFNHLYEDFPAWLWCSDTLPQMHDNLLDSVSRWLTVALKLTNDSCSHFHPSFLYLSRSLHPSLQVFVFIICVWVFFFLSVSSQYDGVGVCQIGCAVA